MIYKELIQMFVVYPIIEYEYIEVHIDILHENIHYRKKYCIHEQKWIVEASLQPLLVICIGQQFTGHFYDRDNKTEDSRQYIV